jgi:hypothetical protein
MHHVLLMAKIIGFKKSKLKDQEVISNRTADNCELLNLATGSWSPSMRLHNLNRGGLFSENLCTPRNRRIGLRAAADLLPFAPLRDSGGHGQGMAQSGSASVLGAWIKPRKMSAHS